MSMFNDNKSTFFLGILLAVTFISLLANVAMFSFIKATNIGQNLAGSLETVEDSLVPSAPSPVAQPEPVVREPSQPVSFNITSRDHILGNPDAPITLVEFSDFECPFCERHLSTMERILSDYKDKVRLVFKHFPLSFHANAQKAAEASECAGEQGKFWEMHDKIFASLSSGLSTDKFKQLAQSLALDVKQFNTCLDSGKFASKVRDDSEEGAAVGVRGTPATFINGQLISGAVPYEEFKRVIDSLLQ